MQAFQWNALRVGDHVRVHDDRALEFELHDGVVANVQTYPHDANDVGIRLDSDAGVIVHPRRHAVHIDGGGARLECWRCAQSRATA
jgi:hypothetical protein